MQRHCRPALWLPPGAPRPLLPPPTGRAGTGAGLHARVVDQGHYGLARHADASRPTGRAARPRTALPGALSTPPSRRCGRAAVPPPGARCRGRATPTRCQPHAGRRGPVPPGADVAARRQRHARARL